MNYSKKTKGYMNKIILYFFAILIFFSCTNNKGQYNPKLLEGTLILQVGFEDESIISELDGVSITVDAEGLFEAYNYTITEIEASIEKTISNLPIDEDIEIAVSAYNSDRDVLASAEEIIVLTDAEEQTVSITLSIEEECPDNDGDQYTDSACGGIDCDDTDPAVRPGATEICLNSKDDDCDGEVDETICSDCNDNDGDGYGNPASDDCTHSTLDCNDNDSAVHPQAQEICDGYDNDCDGSPAANEIDSDEDGYMKCENDCDDEDPLTNPGVAELCDGLDNNCDDVVPANESDTDGDAILNCDDNCPTYFMYNNNCAEVSPNGSDDTETINDAIVNQLNDRGIIILKEGTYNIIGSINIDNKNLSIIGENSNVILKNNYNGQNGMFYIYLSHPSSSYNAEISNLTIEGDADNNTAIFIYVGNSENTVSIHDNVILDSNSENSGGGIYAFVGGSDNSITILNNTFNSNRAEDNGGGIFAVMSGSDSYIHIINNVIRGNSAFNGGGVYAKVTDGSNGEIFLINNTVYLNCGASYGTNGAGIHTKNESNSSTIKLKNNLITDSLGGSGIYVEGISPIIKHNGFSNNIYWQQNCNIALNSNNKNCTPDFVDGLHLGSNSTCDNQGDNSIVNTLSIDADRDGNERIVGTAVDFGAYEVQE